MDGWAVTFGTGRRGLSGLRAPPSPLLAVPNETAHPSTASVPITVLLYDGSLLSGFNVMIKRLKVKAGGKLCVCIFWLLKENSLEVS